MATKPTAKMKADLIGTVQPYKRTVDQKNTPVNKPARRVGNGLSKTGALVTRPSCGGRKPGAKNRTKKEVSEAFLNDLVWCYEKLGGRNWLLKYAKANESDFIKQGLSRLFPTPYQEPADVPAHTVYNNLTLLNRNDPNALRDAALQIAFALRVAVEDDPAKAIANLPSAPARIIEPVKEPPPPYVPEAAAPIAGDFDLKEQAKRAAAHELVADTLDQNISTYHGGGDEQGDRKKPGA